MTQFEPPAETFRIVDEQAIRRAFNAGRFRERADAGELKRRHRQESIHLKGRLARQRGEPRCTRSQMIEYFELSGLKVAIVHQYRRRDGSIGGSGRPDPKWLRVGSEIWTTDGDSIPQCADE